MLTPSLRTSGLIVALAAVLVSAACSGSGSTATIPTAPSTPPTSETFTGTVPTGGTDAHPFTILLSNGQLNVTLTAVGPPATIFMGLGVGTWSNATCTLVSGAFGVTPAGPTAQLAFTGVPAGSYCVSVYDAGNQTADVTYSVTVTHY